MNVAQSLTYDYGSSGTRVSSFSVPTLLTISPFTLLLALASLLLLATEARPNVQVRGVD
jgi:hypothetical protein